MTYQFSPFEELYTPLEKKIISSPIGNTQPGTKEERRELINDIRAYALHITRNNRAVANHYLINPPKDPGLNDGTLKTSYLRLMMQHPTIRGHWIGRVNGLIYV